MAIKHIARQFDYVGLSTDNKSNIVTEGATIYYVDKGYSEIYNNGSWHPNLEGTLSKNIGASLGSEGSETITDTLEHSGNYYWITVIEDAVISAITLDAKETGNTLVGVVLSAGFSNPLLCTSITLTSGKVRMAKRV